MFINKYVTINKHLIARPCSCKITQKQRNMPKYKAGFVSLLTLTLAYMKGKCDLFTVNYDEYLVLLRKKKLRT